MLVTVSILERLGFVLIRDLFDAEQTQMLAGKLSIVLQSDKPAVLRSGGSIYGSRDLIGLLPEVCEIPRQPALREFVVAVLGPQAGVVRALYFDKPPERSWSLPWHKDRTIAVQDNRLPTDYFHKPTVKAGVPHVEAPESLLTQMLTLRLHLDAMTAENGPLSVIPGSHIPGSKSPTPPVEIHASAGDVLAMRPLISHSSSMPTPGTTQHRRIIHLELAPSLQLPDGYHWRWFQPIG